MGTEAAKRNGWLPPGTLLPVLGIAMPFYAPSAYHSLSSRRDVAALARATAACTTARYARARGTAPWNSR